MGYTGLICCLLYALNLPLTTQNQVVCPQTGAVEINQLDEFGDFVRVNRPGGLVELQCKFTIIAYRTDTGTDLFFIEWVKDGTNQLYMHTYFDNQTKIFDDLVVTVTDNFTNIVPSLGQYIQGSSTITLNVTLAITDEFKCNVILKDHTYCDDTTTIQFKDPDITLLSDGEPYYSNYGDPPWREEIPSGNHNVTCEVKHSQNNVPELTMAIMVDDVEITSQSSVVASVNNESFYDGSITASYDVPENVQSTCTVTDARGTYSITSPPADPCNPNPCHHNGTCTTSGDTFDCACLQPWAGETCEANVAVVTTSSLEDGWIALIVIIVLGLLIFLVLVLLFLKKKKERSDDRPESVCHQVSASDERLRDDPSKSRPEQHAPNVIIKSNVHCAAAGENTSG